LPQVFQASQVPRAHKVQPDLLAHVVSQVLQDEMATPVDQAHRVFQAHQVKLPKDSTAVMVPKVQLQQS
jgi:hypothetical protein